MTETKTNSTAESTKRFEGEGLVFRAKLIGMEDLSIDRDEKLCLDAMFKLKVVAKARGDHKQRILLNLTMDALKISDEQHKVQVANHEIERISFVVLDPRDTRAFGYVYNTTDNRHQFWAIKTERNAATTVLALKELFDLAFEQFTNKEKNQNKTENSPTQIEQEKQVQTTTNFLQPENESTIVTVPTIAPPPTATKNDPIVELLNFSVPEPVVQPAPPKKESIIDDLLADFGQPIQPIPTPSFVQPAGQSPWNVPVAAAQSPFDSNFSAPLANVNPVYPTVSPPIFPTGTQYAPDRSMAPGPNLLEPNPTVLTPVFPTGTQYAADRSMAPGPNFLEPNPAVLTNFNAPTAVYSTQQSSEFTSSLNSLSLSSSFDGNQRPTSIPPIAPPSVVSPFSGFDQFNLLAGPTGRTTKDAFFQNQPAPKTIQQLQQTKSP